MIIRKYGIKLTRVREKDIELIRRKRNSSDISNLMHFRERISPAMQKAWFKSIDNIHHNYFVIHCGNRKVGLINGKNSDYVKRESEGGMFIWDKEYLDSAVPALCSIIMSDFTFLLNDFRCNYIKILKSNKKAIRYNKMLGYEATDHFGNDADAQWFVLTKQSYLQNIPKLRKSAGIITQDPGPLTTGNLSFSNDGKEDLARLYEPLPPYIRNYVEEVLKQEGRKLSWKSS